MELATGLREVGCLSIEPDPAAVGYLGAIDAFVDVAVATLLTTH